MSDQRDKTIHLVTSPFAVKKAAGGNQDAVLVAIYPAGAGMGKRFALNKMEHFIGRLEDLDIPLEGEGLSRRHARVYRSEAGWFVEDLGSTNGTHVNDERVSMKQLSDGDLIRTGVAICKFLSGDNIEAAYHEEIYRVSIMDALTAVHNKRYFLEFLEREMAVAGRQQQPLSLAMIDIDHFKKINDTYGHLAGDAALKQLCARLKPRLRTTDLMARYGGEEFAAVLPATPLADAINVSDDLRKLVEAEPFNFEGTKIQATISLGLAQVELGNIGTPTDLIKRADANLYEAKRSGRNKVVG